MTIYMSLHGTKGLAKKWKQAGDEALEVKDEAFFINNNF